MILMESMMIKALVMVKHVSVKKKVLNPVPKTLLLFKDIISYIT